MRGGGVRRGGGRSFWTETDWYWKRRYRLYGGTNMPEKKTCIIYTLYMIAQNMLFKAMMCAFEYASSATQMFSLT